MKEFNTIGKIRYLSMLMVRVIIKSRGIDIKRMMNMGLCLTSALIRRKRVPILPSVIQIDPNNICNLKCTACTTGRGEHPKPVGQMSFKDFCRVVDEVKGVVSLIILYNSGEPFLNKDIYKMIGYAAEHKISVITSTNAILLDTDEKAENLIRSGLDTMIITVSGVTQKTYTRYHVGGDIDKVFSNIDRIVRKKKEMKSGTPKIILRYLLFDYNVSEMDEMKRLAERVGVDYYNFRKACRELRVIKKDAAGDKYMQKEYRDRGHCYWPWLIPVVHWDGTIIPCCHINLSPPEMGNILSNGGLKGVWSGVRYQRFREMILKDKNSIPSCANCESNPIGFQDSFNEKRGLVMERRFPSLPHTSLSPKERGLG
ncbi:MAG: radical SAM/SPASM domain-containing protein [Nitrospirota bacterium]